jgi:hypothetical protein
MVVFNWQVGFRLASRAHHLLMRPMGLHRLFVCIIDEHSQ